MENDRRVERGAAGAGEGLHLGVDFEVARSVERELQRGGLARDGEHLARGGAAGGLGEIARVDGRADGDGLGDELARGGRAAGPAAAAIFGRVGGGDGRALPRLVRVEEGGARGRVGREEEAGDAQRVGPGVRDGDREDVGAGRGLEAEAGDGVRGAHEPVLDLGEIRQLHVLEEEVRRAAREVVAGDREPVDPHLGVGVAGLLALPEAAALEGDPALVGAAGEIDAEALGAEREAVAEERRGIRHGVLDRAGRAEEAEAAIGRVEGALEDARGLRHHLLAGAAEVEGEAPRRAQRRHLHQLDAIDVEGARAAVDEGEARDVRDVEGALDLAAVGPVLLAAPEAAGEVELDHVIAGGRAEAVLVAIVEALVVVLDLEAEARGAGAGVVHGEAQRAVAGPVGDGELRERAHRAGVEPERSLAVGAPVRGDDGLPRAAAGPALDGGIALEVLHDGDGGQPRGIDLAVAAAGEGEREGEGERGGLGAELGAAPSGAPIANALQGSAARASSSARWAALAAFTSFTCFSSTSVPR